MAYNYGIPADQQSYPKPRCWADDRIYNSSSHVCRSCPVEPSCRDQIVRMRNGQRGYAYPSSPNYSPVPAPSPVQVVPYGQPQYPSAPAPQPASAQQARAPAAQSPQAMVGPYPAPPGYDYGWLVDPLYYTMAASPPPMIPTLAGERSLERIGKNMLIEFVRSFFGQGYLAARQMVLPPHLKKTKMDNNGEGG